MTIRSATRADLDEIARQDAEVFGDPYPFFALRQFLDLDAELLLVAEEQGRIRGHAIGARGADESAFVLAIAVVEAARGRGFGAALLDELSRRLEARGARRIRATVAPANGASLALFSSRGFVEIARDEDWFGEGEGRLLVERRTGSGGSGAP